MSNLDDKLIAAGICTNGMSVNTKQAILILLERIEALEK